jgi:2-iminobutanoate/2-iminopropanoate deaminase
MPTGEPQAISTTDAPAAIGPYNQAIAAGGFLFCSGQIPLDPATAKLVEGDVAVQARRVMANLQAVLAAAGATFADVVKTTVYLVDMADFAAVNAAYGEHFPGVAPARATVAVAALPLGARVEIDAVALLRGAALEGS